MALFTPFLIGMFILGYVHLFPIIQTFQSNESDWKVFIFPVSLQLLLLIGGNALVVLFMQYSKVNGGFFLKVFHKQLIANSLISKNYVETKEKKNGSKSKKQKYILPKVHYKRSKFYTEISFPTDGGKHHDKFLAMGKTLEEMLLADLVEEERDFGYITYYLLTDVIANRISIDEVIVDENGIRLMNGLYWNYDEMPHMLVAGGTGGGKSYFLYSLIKGFLQVGTVDVCDPKNADLADLATIPVFKGHVHYGNTPDPIRRCLEKAVDLMNKRYKYMKSLPNYVSGKNYAYYDIPPHFVIVDEWVAFYGALNYQEQAEIMKPIQQIVLKARQAGVFLILAMQRPDSQYLGGGIRDNLMFRVTLGKLAPVGYHMVFGDENKNKPFYNKKIKGRGYVDDGSSVPREFYSPLVPKSYNFLEEFAKVDKMIEVDFSKVQLNKNDEKELEKEFNLPKTA